MRHGGCHSGSISNQDLLTEIAQHMIQYGSADAAAIMDFAA